MTSNLYDTLGVSKTANDTEIKKAYRSLSLKYHPDRNRSAEAQEKMQTINDAYDILKDSSKRRQYDMELRLGVSGLDFNNFGGVPPPMNDLFEMLFSGGLGGSVNMEEMPEIHIFHGGSPFGGTASGFGNMGSSGLHNSLKNPLFKQFQDQMLFSTPKPIHQTISLTYMQAFQGCQLPLEIQRETYVGDMVINEEETVYVSVPPGADDNEMITLKEMGNTNKKNKKGDIKVTIKLEKDPLFSRKGLDLICHKQVTLKEALCGFQFEISHLNGKLLSLNNHKNKAIIHPRFRKTVPNLGFIRGQTKGNLIIEFDVLFPESLNEEQINILEKIL
tara:strand:- start:2422 stop:3417 length:996 start_codon:yes stop_codon:yes gene_type:complete